MSPLRLMRRADGRTAARAHQLLLPSVACANRVCEIVEAERPDARVLTHQHGCAQFGDDLLLTAETLAAIAAHPNVSSAVVIGLGCESNEPAGLVERIARKGGRADLVTIQGEGSVRAAADTVIGLFPRDARDAVRVEVPLSGLRVGLMADEASGDLGRALLERLREILARAGPGCVVAEHVPGAPGARGAFSIPQAWGGARAGRPRALDALESPDVAVVHASDDIERLTALSALGVHVIVYVTGRGSPGGSPVVPTLKVGTAPEWNALAEIIDVPATVADDAETVFQRLLEVAGGEFTAAERSGQRDFALWRAAPSL